VNAIRTIFDNASAPVYDALEFHADACRSQAFSGVSAVDFTGFSHVAFTTSGQQ
jgi:hypothetical protein